MSMITPSLIFPSFSSHHPPASPACKAEVDKDTEDIF